MMGELLVVKCEPDIAEKVPWMGAFDVAMVIDPPRTDWSLRVFPPQNQPHRGERFIKDALLP